MCVCVCFFVCLSCVWLIGLMFERRQNAGECYNDAVGVERNQSDCKTCALLSICVSTRYRNFCKIISLISIHQGLDARQDRMDEKERATPKSDIKISNLGDQDWKPQSSHKGGRRPK